jgi:hypothetical protein
MKRNADVMSEEEPDDKGLGDEEERMDRDA